MALWIAAIGLAALGLTSLLNFVMHVVQVRRVGWRCGKCRPKITCAECGAAAPEFDLGDLRPATKFPRGQSKVIEDDMHEG